MAALRTAGDVYTHPLRHPLRHRLGGSNGRGGRVSQGVPTLLYGVCFTAIGQQAVMANADKASGQNMEQKALEKGVRGHLQGLELIALSPIAVGKAGQPIAGHR